MNQQRQMPDDILNSKTAIALLNAGIDQFGQYGMKATTRSVADMAEANISAIPYYFRSKKGLYTACMHFIVDNIWDTIGGSIDHFDNFTAPLTPAEAEHFYLEIMDTFCGFFLEDPKSLRWSQFIMREHACPTQAYDVFYQRYYKKMQAVKLHLLSTRLQISKDCKRAKIQNHALFGQVLGFLVARESLLSGLQQRDLGSDDIALIKDVVKQHILAVFHTQVAL